MKAWLASVEVWFGDREKREQYLFSIVGIALVAWLGFILLIEPSLIKRDELQKELARVSNQTNTMQQQVQELQARLQADPDNVLNTRQRQLLSRNDRLTEQLDTLAKFIEPDRLLEWLQAVLIDAESQANRNGSLILRSFDTFAPEPFLVDSPSGTVYQHNVEVLLEGNYFAIRDYLQRLQDLPFGFYWQEIDYQVQSYPVALVRLRLYTLSQYSGGEDAK